MENSEEKPVDQRLENQFIELDMFADTDQDLLALGMTVEEIKLFREWQLKKENG